MRTRIRTRTPEVAAKKPSSHCVGRLDWACESGRGVSGFRTRFWDAQSSAYLHIGHAEGLHQLREDPRIGLDGAPRIAHAACTWQFSRF